MCPMKENLILDGLTVKTLTFNNKIKKMIKYHNKLNRSIMLGMVSLVALSCSSQKDNINVPSGEHKIAIRAVHFLDGENTITVNSAGEGRVSDKLLASARAAGNSQVSTALNAKVEAQLPIQSSHEFDYMVDMQTNAVSQDGSAGQSKASTKSAPTKRAADVAMNGNKKFRLIFIKDGSSTPIYNGVLTPGQDPELEVAANQKYKWYAISINDTNTAPDIDASGKISSTDLANKDFMFASGEITTQEDQNYLDILFLRQMSAIDVTVNTRGIFGKITGNSTFSVGSGSGSTFTNIIQTGDFNIYDASFSNFKDADPVKGSEMTVVDSRWGDAEKVARFYTANTSTTVAANNLKVKLNALSITLDDNTSRNFSSNTIVPISHSSSLSLTKGTLSKTNVRLIESGVNVKGLLWARTNLIYDANKLYGSSYTQGKSDAYRFRPNNQYAYANVNTEFWNFGTATPKGTDYQTVDECRRVYPEGTWRLPQELNGPHEITELSQNGNRSTSTTRVSDGYRHSMTWQTSQPANSAYPDNQLVLSYYGIRDANGNVQQQPSGSASGTGILLYRSNRYTSNNTSSSLYAEINNGSFGNTSVQEVAYNRGVTIRCVRNVVNN